MVPTEDPESVSTLRSDICGTPAVEVVTTLVSTEGAASVSTVASGPTIRSDICGTLAVEVVTTLLSTEGAASVSIVASGPTIGSDGFHRHDDIVWIYFLVHSNFSFAALDLRAEMPVVRVVSWANLKSEKRMKEEEAAANNKMVATGNQNTGNF